MATEPAPVLSSVTTIGTRGPGERAASGDGAVVPGSAGVKPQRPVDRPTPVRAKPTRRVLPGDLVCGECGEGNAPSRKFCSRCGTTLATAAVARAPWWRRWLPRRRRRALAAGERPWTAASAGAAKRRGGRFARVVAKLRPVVAVLVLLSGIVLAVSPSLRAQVGERWSDAKASVMRRISPQYSPVSPVEILATSAAASGPELVIDGGTNTSWIAGPDDPEPTLRVRFDRPVDLDRLIVHNGAAEGFKEHSRAQQLHLVFDTGRSFDVELEDRPDAQTLDIDDAAGVTELEIHLVGRFRSLTDAAIALSELEFFERD